MFVQKAQAKTAEATTATTAIDNPPLSFEAPLGVEVPVDLVLVLVPEALDVPVTVATLDVLVGALLPVGVAEPDEPEGVVAAPTLEGEPVLAGTEVAPLISLCTVALKVPVMPLRVNLAEKPSKGKLGLVVSLRLNEVKRMK